MKGSSSKFAAAALAFAHAGSAIQLNIQNTSSIKEAAGEVAKGLYVYHNEAATTGQFNQPQPWFWWLSGSGWNGLMEYTVFTKDDFYKKDLMSALSKNVGPKFDFIPPEQAGWEANDDQAYWVFNALTAMEYNFDKLPGGPSWDVVATNAWNGFVDRWNTETCNGGLKWQYTPDKNGWNYKNAVTNGAFFQTSARLARYTGNQTFVDWATKIWDWSRAVGLVSADYHVYDGTSDDKDANCSTVNRIEWTYNIASYLHGAAHMYNATGDAAWEKHVQGLVATTAAVFFKPAKTGVMFEQNCEPTKGCTTDQTSFKASLSRWLGKTAVLVPSTRTEIMGLLGKSAAGAAQACAGNNNSTCGVSWTGTGFDGQSDFGVELSALETIQSLLVFEAPAFAISPDNHNHPAPSSSSSSATPPASSSSSSAAGTSTSVPAATTTTAATTTATATTMATKTKLPAQSSSVPAQSSAPAHNACGQKHK
ncbi:glycosyl hydrolase family 76-domain-containing protein [Nemania sp. FL0916]|nr:glycosyl hydrolase family 76-domain-containing protein [Nemania sp. FL0916]